MRFLSNAVLFLALTACSATSPDSSSSSQQAQQQDEGGTCSYPSGADTFSDASGSGCGPAPAGRICQVSNGATVLPDGGVANGTETCSSLCPASQFELTCRSSGMNESIPDPDSSLGCTVIPVPTPSDVLFYCCPCGS